MERLFRKSMHDLVKGLRSNQGHEEEFIQKCMVEIRAELDGKGPEAKAAAVQKLTYLQMFGYDMSFASFRVVEVMNQPKFTSKRLGYLAASQSFNEDTEVALLTAALFTKEFVSLDTYQAGLAINCLANIMTKDLARGLAQNVVGLLTTSRPYVRKRAVLCLYPLFKHFPQALRPAFPRLKEKLDDPEMGVQSAAANVICELARKNPKNYLSLAPVFFRILTQSNNTWMLIKVIKLFGALCPLERRLGKKLVEPLSNMINTTSAVSLLYECINTCIVGLPTHTGLIRLCITKLRALVESHDPNLKYLGLVALHKIMLVHPKAVVEHRQMVIGCLDGHDESIRLRALELLTGMVRQRNLMEIVQKLMVKCDEAEQPYKDEVLRKIIEICSQKNYQYVTDFEWYLEVLMELTHVKGSRYGKLISAQFLDVATRVQVIRPLAVHHMTTLLRDPRLMENQTASDTSSQVLYAAAYICGEFSEHVRDVTLVLESMLNPRVASLAPSVQAVYMQNVVKLLARAASKMPVNELASLSQTVRNRLQNFVRSNFTEVQERACFALELMSVLAEPDQDPVALMKELTEIFAEQLNPVASLAQRKVPVPAGLDLDAQINEQPPESDDEDPYDPNFWHGEGRGAGTAEDPYGDVYAPASGGYQGAAGAAARPRVRNQSVFHLGYKEDFGSSPTSSVVPAPSEVHQVERLTPADLNLPSGGHLSGHVLPVQPSTRGGHRRRRRQITVMATEEMPTDAVASDEETKVDVAELEDSLDTIDLTTELQPDEQLPTLEHHKVVEKLMPVQPVPGTTTSSHDGKHRGRRHRSGRPHRGDKPDSAEREHRRRHRRHRGDKSSSSRDGSKSSGADRSQRSSSSAAVVAPTPVAASANLVDLGSPARHASPTVSSTSTPPPAAAAAAESPAAAAGADPTVASITTPSGPCAAQDAFLGLRHSVSPDGVQLGPGTHATLVATMFLANLGNTPLSQFSFAFAPSSHASLVATSAVSPQFVLRPRGSCNTQMQFAVKDFAHATHLDGRVLYTPQGAAPTALPFRLNLGATTLVSPLPIDSAAQLPATPPGLSVQKLRVHRRAGPLSQLARRVATELNLHVVATPADDSALLIGQAGVSAPVLVMIKQRSKGFSLELKTAYPPLAEALAKILSRVLPRA